MNKKTIDSKIKKVLQDHIYEHLVSEVVETTHLEKDLGVDSLDLIEIMLGLEREFKFEIPDRAFDNLETYGQLYEYVEGRVKECESLLD